MMRPASHSFSLQRPTLSQDSKKTRNSKRLSLFVPPSPGKLETLASLAAATPTFPPSSSLSSSSSSTATSTSTSSKRHFSSSLSTSLSTISQSPITTPTADESTKVVSEAAETNSRRHSQLLLDQALPTPRLPLAVNQPKQRPISAYFADFSAECGTASPYTKEPVCVLPHLYLGAEHNAVDVKVLSRLGITAVLNVAIEISNASQQQYQLSSKNMDRIVKTAQGRSIHYKNLSWTHHQRDLQSEFPLAFAFIEEIKNMGGKVLIHCQLGVSRSASLVIAYVMKTLQMNLTDAYDFVKTRSSVVSPNMSLMYQLAEFGKSLEEERNGKKKRPTLARLPSNKSTWAASREDEDDYYPYPTERMDMDVEMSSPCPSPSPSAIPKTPTASSSTNPFGQSQSPSAPVTTRRPRSSYNRSAPPMPLSSLMTAKGASHFANVPQTPMTDRFSIPDIVPATPMKDRFSFSSSGPWSSSSGQMDSSSALSYPPSPSLASSPERFPEGESFVLSPPVRPFVTSHKPMSSSSSMSSFESTASFSRPSSTSSTFSNTLSIYESETSSTMAMSAASPASVVTPLREDHRYDNKNYSYDDDNHPWAKIPSTSVATTTPTGSGYGSYASPLKSPMTPTFPSSSSSSISTTSKKTGIHSLAKALTRRWSNQQQQQQSIPPPPPSPSVVANV
ncbi:Dual specificity protein phosphatase 1 [Lobosporangium transversale]|nr:Dual specificity protein phosphatase 1 [Lobosporangium transversale]